VRNVAERWGDALTGPVARAEITTIQRHLEALRTRAPDLLDAYVLTTRTVLFAARRAGRIDAQTERTLTSLLEAP
jgi:predicted short-subunit dehydrogenase-like oxidoreductase (DUF2520 family)